MTRDLFHHRRHIESASSLRQPYRQRGEVCARSVEDFAMQVAILTRRVEAYAGPVAVLAWGVGGWAKFLPREGTRPRTICQSSRSPLVLFDRMTGLDPQFLLVGL